MGRKIKYHFTRDKDWLHEHYITKNMSIQKIADAEEFPYYIIRNALLKAGIAMKPQKIYGHVNHPNRKGENHPRWKGGNPKCLNCSKQLTFGRTRCWDCYRKSIGIDIENYVAPRPSQADRFTHEYKKWRTALFKHYEYKCYICKKHDRKLIAHHLNAYSTHPKERLDFDNGVVLCSKHHSYFHKNYGFYKNTKEQFHDYLSNLAEII